MPPKFPSLQASHPMVQPTCMNHGTKRRRRLTSYSIKSHYITLDPRKTATTELTRGPIHDIGYVAAIPTTSAMAFLSSIYCSDELLHHPGAQDGIRVGSLIRSPTSSSRTSSCSTIERSPMSYSGPKSDSVHKNLLIEFEEQSKFLCQTLLCSSCGKSGANFPKCGKCEKAWCSRDCRLKAKSTHECARQKFRDNLRADSY